ncbi:hypothetical protein D3C72_1896360 [compost metagenome]
MLVELTDVLGVCGIVAGSKASTLDKTQPTMKRMGMGIDNRMGTAGHQGYLSIGKDCLFFAESAIRLGATNCRCQRTSAVFMIAGQKKTASRRSLEKKL